MSLLFICMKSYVAVATRLIFYRLEKRVQLLNRQINPKGTRSLSFLHGVVLFVLRSNFSGAFNLFVVG